jgi:hypothetical protein
VSDLLAILQRNAAQTTDLVLRERLEAAIDRLRQRSQRRGEPRQGRRGGESTGRPRSYGDRATEKIMGRYE